MCRGTMELWLIQTRTMMRRKTNMSNKKGTHERAMAAILYVETLVEMVNISHAKAHTKK